MKKYTKILLIILFSSTILYFLTTFTYWIMNPKLTEMEVFLEFWYWFVVNMGLSVWFIKVDLT